ncbi:MAG: hypothetical protein ACOVMH_02220 [Flavobacterium sp.]
MSKILRYFKNEHGFEHDLKEKKKHSEPKIYDANGNLAKRRYIYFSFHKKADGKFKKNSSTQKNLLICKKDHLLIILHQISCYLKLNFND